MRMTALRLARCGGLSTIALATMVSLSLAAYCAQRTGSYVASAQPISGTNVAVEKPVSERHRDDFRPVVAATLPSGETVTRRFTGLYRVPEDAVGQPMELLYNPTGSPTVVPDSSLNWIGSMVYGGISLALMTGFGLLWLSGRWIPPAQAGTTRNGSPALS